MESENKIRLDILVAKVKGCSRAYASELITGGCVTADGLLKSKPGEKVTSDIEERLVITPPATEYVSRGGKKLEKALELFGISVDGKTCMDIGASTGGFTDCLLQRGAKMVYAVDVGTGQLSAKLAEDERVVSLPQTDVRLLKPEDIGRLCGFICIDVSFISITKVIGSACGFLDEHGEMVCLIKPQFEAGAGNVNKNGIVKDKKVHIRVLENVYKCFTDIKLNIAGVTLSPVKGGDGNTEYLMYLCSSGTGMTAAAFKKEVLGILDEVRL